MEKTYSMASVKNFAGRFVDKASKTGELIMAKRLAVNERGLRIGEDHHNARYTNGEVDMVHQLRDNGWGYKRISRAVEMPLRTVRDICSGRRRCQTTAGWRSV